jgi:hypothetical protein
MTGEVNEVHSGSLSDHSLGISYHNYKSITARCKYQITYPLQNCPVWEVGTRGWSQSFKTQGYLIKSRHDVDCSSPLQTISWESTFISFRHNGR